MKRHKLSEVKRHLIKKLEKIEKDIEKLIKDDLRIDGSRYCGPTKIKYLLGVDLLDELIWDLFDHHEQSMKF